jgi:hypothetical protein
VPLRFPLKIENAKSVRMFCCLYRLCGRKSLQNNLFEDQDSIHDSTPPSSSPKSNRTKPRLPLTEAEREDLWEDFFNLTRILEKLKERCDIESNNKKKNNLEKRIVKCEKEAVEIATLLKIL